MGFNSTFKGLKLHLPDAVKLTKKAATIRVSSVYSVQVSGSRRSLFLYFPARRAKWRRKLSSEQFAWLPWTSSRRWYSPAGSLVTRTYSISRTEHKPPSTAKRHTRCTVLSHVTDHYRHNYVHCLLARSQCSEGPATGHLDTGFSWFPCVYKQMLRWFPRFQVATTCFSCSPPDLNLIVINFMFCLHVK